MNDCNAAEEGSDEETMASDEPLPPGPVLISVERIPYGDVEADLAPETHNSIGLHLCGRSTLEWTTGARPQVGRPSRGDVTLVPAGRAGRLRVRGGPSEVLKLIIPGAALHAWADQDEAPGAPAPLLDRFACRDRLVQEIGLALLAEVERPAVVDHLYRDALSNALIAHLLRRHSEFSAPATERRTYALSESRARRAVAFMESNLTRDIGVDDVARELGLSASHFAAQFRTTFRRPPAQYLTWLRLERARALLRSSDLPVADIAEQVGFAGASHFAQAFRNEFGVTPTDCRRERS